MIKPNLLARTHFVIMRDSWHACMHDVHNLIAKSAFTGNNSIELLSKLTCMVNKL